MKKYFRLLLRLIAYAYPPPEWRLPVIILCAVFCGLGLVVLRISNAFSYISDDPAVCMNCHVMTTQYATWQRGGHGLVTNCNGCHVPHQSAVQKYAFKAMDGLRHSFMFTFRLEPQVIRIKEAGIHAVQNNCLRCHENAMARVNIPKDEVCWKCHRETPHGRINSLSATPFVRVPKLK